MGYRNTQFAVGEWYHCYSRGVEGRVTYEREADYKRFLQTLYLCNNTQPAQRMDLYQPTHEDFFAHPRAQPLVAIGAYCLMPTHYHLLMQETSDEGISKFMQKVGTAYTMYFNTKNQRVGNLFVKPFRSRHISDDMYLQRVVHYIHLNPAELQESGWKSGKVHDMHKLKSYLYEYAYSSLKDFAGTRRIESKILDETARQFLSSTPTITLKALKEMQAYYAELYLKATP